MSFFKDFKDDLSLAVNELLPGEDFEMEEEMDDSSEMMVNTLDGDLDIESELSKLDGLLEHVDAKDPVKHVQIQPEEPVLEQAKDPVKPAKPVKPVAKEQPKPQPVAKEQPKEQPKSQPSRAAQKEESIQAAISRFDTILEPEKKEEPKPKDKDDLPFDFDALLREAEEKPQRTQPKMPQPVPQPQPAEKKVQSTQNFDYKKPSTTMKEEIPMNEELTKEMTAVTMEDDLSADSLEVTDEVSIITTGTTIKGNLSTTGSFSISGRVEGNVQCNGKLEVTGTIKGNSSSSEVFSDAAKIEGEIMSTGTVKIGLGSVVVGNIAATSAVIAGAVKGDIDVQGPVVVDTSAVIVGNIKSRSVQINNGAVIEGFCSQCYADIEGSSLFGENKKGKYMKRVLLKLSGEALAGEKKAGFDEATVCNVAKQVKKLVDDGIEVGIVIGGGNFWRGRTSDSIDRTKADQIGMLATVMNCIYVSEIFRSQGMKTNVLTPFSCGSFTKLFSKDRANKYFDHHMVVFFAGGTGHPYFSTDTAAVLRAVEIEADGMLLAKAVDGVYDSDPKLNPNAVRYDTLSIEEVIDKKLAVVDLTASIMCMEHKLPMYVFSLNQPDSIVKAISGNFNGTVITV